MNAEVEYKEITQYIFQKTHYLPRRLCKKLKAHIRSEFSMAEVRKNYWIPKLRGLANKTRSNCFGCKRFQITAFANPPP